MVDAIMVTSLSSRSCALTDAAMISRKRRKIMRDPEPLGGAGGEGI
jgi:hypothetical protein